MVAYTHGLISTGAEGARTAVPDLSRGPEHVLSTHARPPRHLPQAGERGSDRAVASARPADPPSGPQRPQDSALRPRQGKGPARSVSLASYGSGARPQRPMAGGLRVEFAVGTQGMGFWLQIAGAGRGGHGKTNPRVWSGREGHFRVGPACSPWRERE